MPKVFVEPIGITLTVDEQENLLDGLVRAQIDIPTDCAGRGTCGKCLVRLGSGELTAPTERELKRIPEKLRAEGWRLACQAYPRSARVSIEVRGTAGQRRILTTSKLTHGAAHPAVCTRSVQLEPPTLADKRSDLERFDEGLGGVEVPLHVLEELPATLRDGKWKVTATLLRQARHRRAPGRARPRVLRRGRRHRHLQGHRLPLRPAPRRAHRPGGRREPADALRRGRHQPHRARRAAQRDGRCWPRPSAAASTPTSRRSTSARTSTPTTSAT